MDKYVVIYSASDAEGQDVMAAGERSGKSKLLDTIIQQFGKFGRSLGQFAQSMMRSGYGVNKITKSPESTTWRVGNDEYNKTRGQSGYLCEIKLTPVATQDGKEQAFAVDMTTVSGLNDHSFTIPSVTASKLKEVIRSTMLEWDVQDNDNANALQELHDEVAEQGKNLLKTVKQECEEAKKKATEAEADDATIKAIDELKRDATNSVETSTKKFERAYRDAQSLKDRIQYCNEFGDVLDDNADTFNKSLADIMSEIEGVSEDDDSGLDYEDKSGENSNSESIEVDFTDMTDYDDMSSAIQLPERSIVASVIKHNADGEVTFDLKRIVASLNPSEAKATLETVLYDANILESVPEDTETMLQVTDDGEDWNIEFLAQDTTLNTRSMFIELLKSEYIAMLSIQLICWNARGPQASGITMLLQESLWKLRDQIDILSKMCVAMTGYVPNVIALIDPSQIYDPESDTQVTSGLEVAKDALQMLIDAISLYRCNFREDFQFTLMKFLEDLRAYVEYDICRELN